MKQPWPQLLCLDLDDTILAFTDSAEPCWQRICGKYASRIEGLSAEALLAAINEVRAWYWADLERHRRGRLNLNGARREIVAEAFSRLQIGVPEWINELADSYTSEREETVQPFPGAMEALHQLRHQSNTWRSLPMVNPRPSGRRSIGSTLHRSSTTFLLKRNLGLANPIRASITIFSGNSR